ncbi:hypothetical protein [Rhodococcus jostii]|uniref:hypothetical protein n=1 Tax=Rhodococcus jostii TaxID=132919 RepID=UPI0036574AD4
MTNFRALYGGARGFAAADAEVRLPTLDGVVHFLGPCAGYLMCLGAVAAPAGSISSTDVIGRMTVSNEGTVLLGGRGTFVIGFMARLA